MNRLLPLLPPLSLVLLVVAASADGLARFDDASSFMRSLPVVAAGVAYILIGRRKPAR